MARGPRITEEQKNLIREQRATGSTQAMIAEALHISQGAVSRILRNESVAAAEPNATTTPVETHRTEHHSPDPPPVPHVGEVFRYNVPVPSDEAEQ